MVPVSVVIPCYRCVPGIRRAVASVRMQTAPPAEMVFVDDGSGDGSGDVLRELADELKGLMRVRIFELETNKGAASARNAGWDQAAEEYIAFLDADDVWHPRKLEYQYGFMTAHPAFALCGHAHETLTTFAKAPDRPPAAGYCEVTLDRMLWSNRFTTSSVMVRRDVQPRFREGQRHMEDQLLWLTMSCAGLRAARLDAVLSYRYSAPFGDAGLSAQLMRMQSAELKNYWLLHRRGCIGAGRLGVLWLWSLAKFARRLVIVALRGFSRVRGT